VGALGCGLEVQEVLEATLPLLLCRCCPCLLAGALQALSHLWERRITEDRWGSTERCKPGLKAVQAMGWRVCGVEG
jgi:hypothetical protein